jgi:CheY-like chemotaxis protein
MKPCITKTFHVLFVDDDQDESYLFQEALDHLSIKIKVTHAYDGNDLMAQLNVGFLPDIVFLDLNMPYKDGAEALVEIRGDSRFDKLPLVIYSTANNLGYIETCYEKGASLFVIKPTSFKGIMEVVADVLARDWKAGVRVARQNFVISATPE